MESIAILPSAEITAVPYRPSVLVLIDSKHANQISGAGRYRTISENWFPAIGVGIVEMAIPRDMSGWEVVGQLAAAFPTAAVAMNDTVKPLGAAGPGAVPLRSGTVNDGVCASNERIGVIDGPADPNHEVFAGHSVVRKSFLADSARKSDSAHSTAVLSILTGTHAQVSTESLNISMAEIFEKRDTGVAGSLLSTVRALDWLVGEGAAVINMSLQSNENAVFSRVLDRVAQSGTIMVAAAGDQRPGQGMVFPAAHPKVIAVTAVDQSGEASPYANRGAFIDFAAPGVNVPIATVYGTGRGSGTSYAAPYVTSIVALALAGGAPRDVDRIRRLVANNATDLGERGKDDIYGWGLPDVQAQCSQHKYSSRR